MDRKKVDSLYCLYGFSKEYENDSFSVYLFEQGYFNNAEIVLFKDIDRKELEKTKEDYIKSGYAVSVKKDENIETIEEELFQGFFKIELSNKRVQRDYDEFCKIQTRKSGGIQYTYISSQYTINGQMGSGNIVDYIHKQLLKEGAQLIILEAPAGFGKTCTSYEISKVLSENTKEFIPILAELSKNRTAKIFDYVLYSEIDKKFSQLSSSLVTSQIIKGKLPLLIDGFDELLSKSSTNQADSAEDAKSMLDTVANLFTTESNAKVLLTSRKSSIFVGEIFENWVNQKIENGTINRIQILTPTISDWIGSEKELALTKAGIKLESVANPVLLSVLKGTDLSKYDKQFRESSDILDYYFNIVFRREKERQQLLLEPYEQRIILQKLASMMVQLDIDSDDPEGIKALIEEIVSNNIVNYLRKYSDQEEFLEPTEDEFIMKLVHNAFLDRLIVNSNNIGFINEYIFGIFIGEAVVNKYINITDVKGKYLSFAISAFTSETVDNIDKLLSEIEKIKSNISTEQKLLIESCLTHRMTHDYVDEYISNYAFDNSILFDGDHYFYNCIFSDCIFRNLTLRSDLFEGCHFINCSFYDVVIEKADPSEEVSTFVSCVGYEELEAAIGKRKETENIFEEKDDTYFERVVLEQFWMTGSNHADLRRSYTTLFKGIPSKDREAIKQALDRLYDRKILVKKTHCAEINKGLMKEVKDILGR